MVKIKKIELDDLKKLNDKEEDYVIFYGNGNNFSRWIKSITNVFQNYGIISMNFQFKNMNSFENENKTYLIFALNDKEFNIKKLLEHEVEFNQLYGLMLLSHYSKIGYKSYHIDNEEISLDKIKI
ncbi:MAG: hypothetical protein IJ068_00350 [Bacilli bacterium]|nr:hypothetical protein [Bacilli bacterium]